MRLRRVSTGTDSVLVTNRRSALRKVIIGNVTSAGHIKLYDTATAPTAGAGTPVACLWSGTVGGKSPAIFEFERDELVFVNGIGMTIVVGAADNDATAVLANQLCVHLFWDDGGTP